MEALRLLPLRRRLWTAFVAAGLVMAAQNSALAQAKLPLPDPGSDHAALFVRLMEQLCEDMGKAAAAGTLPQFTPSAERMSSRAYRLIEKVQSEASRAPGESWILRGEMGAGSRVHPHSMPAVQPTCSAGSPSDAVQQSARGRPWASCELRPAPAARCRLWVEETELRVLVHPPHLNQRSYFSLTLLQAAQPTPPGPAPVSPRKTLR